ncbi:MAG: uroporphyrinogen-III synthase [Balneolales bacterium]|nr:uroporphyrinogen-III synthase [Balneolales bacterium]
MKPPIRVWFTRSLSDEETAAAAKLGIEAAQAALTGISFFGDEEVLAQTRSLPKPDALLFTSRNAVPFFLRLKDELPQNSTVFAVGERTAALLTEAGLSVHQPDAAQQHGRATGRMMAANLPESAAVWHFAAESPRHEAREELEAAGIRYHHISCYKTEPLKPVSIPADIRALAFYSPSAVQAWLQLGEKPGASLPAFAIGGTTALALQQAGFQTIIEAPQPSTGHLLQAVHAYFSG